MRHHVCVFRLFEMMAAHAVICMFSVHETERLKTTW
jgi:hypothetical protein